MLEQTSAMDPDPEQVIRQAELISCLIDQRDMFVRQAEEQRLRWNSEKDGWARMAEALIAQQAKHRSAADKDEVSDFDFLSSRRFCCMTVLINHLRCVSCMLLAVSQTNRCDYGCMLSPF